MAFLNTPYTRCTAYYLITILKNLAIELLNNNSHGLSPPGGLVSPSGGFLSLLCDQGLHFASIKLCLALSRQGAIIKIPVVRCHCLWCLGAQFLSETDTMTKAKSWEIYKLQLLHHKFDKYNYFAQRVLFLNLNCIIQELKFCIAQLFLMPVSFTRENLRELRYIFFTKFHP